MDLKRKYPTCLWAWKLLSALLFLAGGFIDFMPTFDKGTGLQYWQRWLGLLEGDYPYPGPVRLLLAVFTVMLAVSAIALGWVLQGLVVLACGIFRSPAAAAGQNMLDRGGANR